MTGLVTVFGAGGFVGRYVCAALLRDGWRVRAAERNPVQAMAIKPLGDLGQTQFISADVTNPASVARAVQGADAVINLVGVFGKAMQAVHVDGARHVAEAAAAAGARALVHMSAIGADTDSPARYGQTKAAGEAAVFSAFPTATIMRPSVVFGAEDQFLNRFAGLICAAPMVPVIGSETRLQPVFAGDVGAAFAAVLANPARFGGKIFELGGPEALSMLDLNDRIAHWIGRPSLFAPLPSALSSLIATATGWLPGAPISRDQFKMLSRDNVVSGMHGTLADLGITPTAMAAIAPEYLARFRKYGRFGAGPVGAMAQQNKA